MIGLINASLSQLNCIVCIRAVVYTSGGSEPRGLRDMKAMRNQDVHPEEGEDGSDRAPIEHTSTSKNAKIMVVCESSIVEPHVEASPLQ